MKDINLAIGELSKISFLSKDSFHQNKIDWMNENARDVSEHIRLLQMKNKDLQDELFIEKHNLEMIKGIIYNESNHLAGLLMDYFDKGEEGNLQKV